jgi:hypothetical protein
VPRENAFLKARRYLSEGRLTVRYVGPEGIRAIARGGGAWYHVIYRRGGWSCTCPAVGACCHLLALQLVTTTGPGGT